MTLNIARRRLAGAPYVLEFEPFEDAPRCAASLQPGVGFYQVTLESFDMDSPLAPDLRGSLDAVDNWSVGYLREDGYHCMAEFARTRREPKLQTRLDAPVYAGDLALCVADVTGRCFYYRIGHT